MVVERPKVAIQNEASLDSGDWFDDGRPPYSGCASQALGSDKGSPWNFVFPAIRLPFSVQVAQLSETKDGDEARPCLNLKPTNCRVETVLGIVLTGF